MPIVIPAAPSIPSAAQSVGTSTVYDYLLDEQGNALANQQVLIALNTSQANSITPQTTLLPKQVTLTTDANGFWSAPLVPNSNINPANTTYTVRTPLYSYDITVGAFGPYQSTAVGTIVNVPTALAPGLSNLTGPLTVAGLLTALAGASVTGGLTVTSGGITLTTGGFTLAGPLTMTSPASQILPGATSFSVRDTANANDNLLVSNAGLVTARAGLVATAGGLTVTAGGLTVTAGGLTVSAGASALQATTVTGGLTVAAGGLTVTAGASTITPDLTLGGRLLLSTAVSKIIPGATSLSLRNNADNADNLIVTDAGAATIRSGLNILGTNVGAGTLTYAQVVATQGTFTTLTDIVGLFLTLTPAAGRRIRLTALVGFSSSVASDSVGLEILEGATVLGLFGVTLPAANQTASGALSVILTTTNASHTYKVSAVRLSGSGNITMQAGGTFPAYLLAEDIGT